MNRSQNQVNLDYVLITLAAVLFSWTLHEFAHWVTGEVLGNKMVMTLNTCYPESGSYTKEWHEMVISAAGPVLTIIQALVFYFLLSAGSVKLFPFLLTCLYMRALAGAMNFINLNDEGRISSDLGLGTFTLSIGVVSLLFYLTYRISKSYKLTAKLIVATILLIMLFSSVVILSDQALKIRIL